MAWQAFGDEDFTAPGLEELQPLGHLSRMVRAQRLGQGFRWLLTCGLLEAGAGEREKQEGDAELPMRCYHGANVLNLFPGRWMLAGWESFFPQVSPPGGGLGGIGRLFFRMREGGFNLDGGVALNFGSALEIPDLG